MSPHSYAPVDLEHPPCRLCGSERFTTVLDNGQDLSFFKPGRFQLQRCDACALVQTRPRPVPGAALDFYYADTYSDPKVRAGLRDFYEGPLGEMINQFRLVALERARPLTAADRVLDVGCGYGHFLDWIRRQRGCQIAGIDTDAAQLADALAPEVCSYTVGTISDLPDDTPPFTVITFLECLEHDPDPVAALQAAGRRLVAGGLVCVEVPNWDGIWRMIWGRFWMPLLLPQHLVHFSPDTLRATFVAAGFEVVHHQAFFTLAELVSCFERWVYAMISPGRPPPSWLRMALLPLNLLLLIGVDLPLQVILRLLGRSGHQTMVGRKL
ncbi:MAG: methyltransferase domain-containing protein [Myxococcota bacterium]